MVAPNPRPLGSEARRPTSIIEQVWSSLSDAMVLSTPGDADQPPSVVVANAAFCTLFGLPAADVAGRPLGSFLSIDGSSLRERIDDLVGGHRAAIEDLVVVRGAVGGAKLVAWELTAVHAEDGRVERLLALLHDVTRSVVRRPLGLGSDVDPVTGLPNRLHLFSRLERSVEQVARAAPYTFAAIAVVAEGLYAVERRLGPAMAGALLEAVVHRLRRHVRAGDLVAKVGREQLVIVLDHFAPEGIVDDVLGRVIAAIEPPYSIAGRHITLRMVGAAGPVCSGDYAPGGARDVMDAVERAVAAARNGAGDSDAAPDRLPSL